MKRHLRTLLLASAGLTFPVAAPAAALAQASTAEATDAQQEADDGEIVVTGIRASLANSINRKRNADQIVDTITAEDIGKLPDQNVAESIQRITGVQITRDEGEGRRVNIRGLSAQTTINDRVQLGANTRDYDFRNLAAEFFQAIEVYKSPIASQPEGALGGTVNLITRKPLDLNKPTLSLGLEGVFSDYAEKLDPSASLFVAGQFADGTLGASLSATYSRRHVRSDYFQTLGGWVPSRIGIDTGFDFNPDDAFVDQDVIRPADLRYRTQNGERTRYGFDGTIQWQPSDSFEARLDGTYTRFENVFRNAWFRTFSNNYQSFVPGSLEIDENGSLLGGTFLNQRVEVDGRYESEPVNLYTTGLNLKWNNDRLTVTGDVNYSKSTNMLLSQFLRFQGTQTATADFSFRGGDTPPTLALTNADGSPYDLLSPQLYVANLAQDRTYRSTSDEYAGRADVTYDVGGVLRTLSGGVRLTSRTNTFRVATSANQAGNRSNPAFFDPDGRQRTVAETPFAEFIGVFPWTNGLFENVDGVFPRAWLLHHYPSDDPDIGSPEYLDAFNIRDYGGQIPSIPEHSDVAEDVTAAYVMTDWAGDLGGLPFRGNVGLRYVHTNTESSGLFRNADGVVEPVSQEADSGEWLPAANLTLDLQDDLLLRFAAARVMQRPELGQLSTGYNINLSSGFASVGNPGLKAYIANQADVSLEWYPTPETLISAAAFYKDVGNFTTTLTYTGTIPGVTRLDGGTEFQITQPVNGGGASIKGFELGLQLPLLFLPAPLDGFGIITNFTYAKSEAKSEDPVPGRATTSINLIGYYERDNFSARIAYSRRSRYSETGEGGNGSQGIGLYEYIAPAGYMDASLSYDILPNVTFVVDVANLLRTKQIRYSELESRLRDLSTTDRRISVGARVRF